MAFQCRGPRGLSPAIATLLNPTSAYGQLLYLDRGYAFFAPDPGPSHLMAVELSSVKPAGETNDGESAPESTDNVVIRVPSLNDQWPRLKYHRHFMLAEFLNDSYQPSLPRETASLVGPDLSAEELRVWRLGRDRYEAILNSMVNHVETRYPGKTVRIDRLEHRIPDFVGFATRKEELNDDSTYVLLEDIDITLETLLGTGPSALPEPGLDVNVETEPVPAPSGERVESKKSNGLEVDSDPAVDSDAPMLDSESEDSSSLNDVTPSDARAGAGQTKLEAAP